MKTIKEMAKLTGISARTLHYYDEIGLLVPTSRSEVGYRLYDDKSLEVLQQILFFKEFDIPLKEIKTVMEHPDFDRNSILQMQRKMLVSKKERMERLIASIDDILKGEKQMDFTVFNDTEIHTMYDKMVENMNEEQKQVFISQYGSMNAFRAHFFETASSKQAQENFAQVVKWYGSKEAAMASMDKNNPNSVSNDITSCQTRIGEIMSEISAHIGADVHSAEITALVEEYISLSKKLYQMEDVTDLMSELAKEYTTNKKMQEITDSIYGAGTTEYFGLALAAYIS